MSNDTTYYFPWVRKGLNDSAAEQDILGDLSNSDSLLKQRPTLLITADYQITPPENENSGNSATPLSVTKEIQFVSPGDVLKVSVNAILKTVPAEEEQGFTCQFYPYIEFWEPDFPWRYTPAQPNNNKLSPWLALLVCEESACAVRRLDDGSPYVSLNISEENRYKRIFLSPRDTWKTAHAQSISQTEPEFSRLIALRRFGEENDLTAETDYVAFLVPSFETGRLRGLGFGDDALEDIPAQAPAWEESLALQKSKHPQRPLDFPVYYSWNFKTGGDSFEALVKKLKKAEGLKAENKIDVSRMGNGFDYDILDVVPERKVIGMPAATKVSGNAAGRPFPSATVNGERTLYERLKLLMDNSPVFKENLAEITSAVNAVGKVFESPAFQNDNSLYASELTLIASSIGTVYERLNNSVFTVNSPQLVENMANIVTNAESIREILKIQKPTGSQASFVANYVQNFSPSGASPIKGAGANVEISDKISVSQQSDVANYVQNFSPSGASPIKGAGTNVEISDKIPVSQQSEKTFVSATELAVIKSSLTHINEALKVFKLVNSNSVEVGDDDPWVTPPMYGGKHIMATHIKDLKDGTVYSEDAPEWMSQLNLDIHYRAAAGLGKRTVQIHQEEFVNRAWKQVEAVNALNYELYKRLLSVNTNDALKDKVLGTGQQYNAHYIARMMRYLSSMKNAQLEGGLSMKQILQDSNIPTSFASASFQHLADDIAERVPRLNADTIMQNIAKDQIFSNMPDFDHVLTSIGQLYSKKHPHRFVPTVLDNEQMKNIAPLLLAKISPYFKVELNTNTKNNIANYFRFTPKPINHSVENNANYIFAPNYKLKRYNDFFKDMLRGWTLSGPFTNDYWSGRFSNRMPYVATSGAYAPAPAGRRRYCTNFLNQSELGKPIYSEIHRGIEAFLDSGKTEHLCYGYTSDRVEYLGMTSSISSSDDYCIEQRSCAKRYGKANVIVLSDSEFEKMFYEKDCIVRLGGEDGYYFVPKRILRNYSYSDTTIRSFVHLPDSYSEGDINSADNYIEAQVVRKYAEYQSSMGIPEYTSYSESYKGVPILVDPAPTTSNQLFTGGRGKYWYNPSQLYYPLLWKIFELWRDPNQKVERKGKEYSYINKYYDKDIFCNTLINHIRPAKGISPVFDLKKNHIVLMKYYPCRSTSYDRKEYEFLHNITEYLFEVPDHIELNVDRFTQLGGKVIYLDKGYDYMYHCLRKVVNNHTRQEWSKHSCYIEPWYEFHKTLKKLNGQISITQNQQASAAININPDAIEQWRASADHSEAYERMKEVAETYYAEFFANNEGGEQLRGEYIEELLQSKYPILAYPIFPEPAYHYLKMFSEKFFIPCVDELPDHSVALFLSNEAFTEAYLCGMNTEMGRELLWREYPTDQRGSYFRKFWDSETTAEDIHKKNFFDIKPLHTWTGGKLGSHHEDSKTGLLLFLIKGNLLKQFPSTQVFLHRAKGTYNAAAKTGTLAFDFSLAEEFRITKPIIQAYMREDIYLVGFKMEFNRAVGNPSIGDYGYFLAFKEDVQDLNFDYEDMSAANDAADVANILKNDPTLYGKHLSLFI